MEIILSGAHLLAIGSVWMQPLPAILSLGLSLLLIYGLRHSMRLLKSRFRLYCDRHGRWFVGPVERAEPVTILAATVASRIGLFLSYRHDGQRRVRSRFIPVWVMRVDDYRQIRQRITVTVDRDRIDR